MPVQKYSAMDPSGSWNMDARDQAAMWNADRGDRINMWQTNRMDQRGQDDWRRDVALKQLDQNREFWQGNRDESAAERAARYGFMGEELGLRREESAADRALRERGFGLQERGMNLQLSEAERAAKQRADEETALGGLDVSQLGVDGGVYSALPASLKSQVAVQALTRQLDKAQRPAERAQRGEDVRGQMALQSLSQLEQKGQVTPREAAQYAQASAEAQKQGYGGTGGLAPQQVKAQEFAKQQARAIIQRADELAGGLLGYASSKDIQEILDSTSDLASTMEQAGYPPQEINAVMQSIQSRLDQINANDFRTEMR